MPACRLACTLLAGGALVWAGFAQSPAGGRSATQLYRNPRFGFTYAVPFGWVDRTRALRADSPAEAADSTVSQVLLAVFERPPEAQETSLNPGVVIAAEPVSAYHNLKTAADYFTPLKEVTSSRGFEMQGDPYDTVISTHHLARGDFIRHTKTGETHQATLVLLEKSSVISFTFIAAGEDEVNTILQRLKFTAP